MSIYLLLSTRQIIGRPVKITDNDYRVTYDSKIDRDICLDHDIDYIKVQNLTPKKDVERLNEFKDVSLTTAAAVTAYARVYMSKLKKDMSKLKKDMSKLKKDMSKLKKDMSKLKKDILNRGGNIYYTDTDSIVTDIPLDDSLVGEGLGMFKLEYKIEKGSPLSGLGIILRE
jgi:uncharacterized protein (DUF342 family)